MIIFDEKIVGVWYVSTIPNQQDWQAGLRELVPEEKYELMYRFRYYRDDKIFDSEDKRNWYRAECSGTRAYCLAGIRVVAHELAKVHGAEVYETLNFGDLKDFMKRFGDQPFVFLRMEHKPDGKPKDGIGRVPV